jgi:hypothetical protein
MLAGLFTIQTVERLQQLWRQMATTVGGQIVLSGHDLSLPNGTKFGWPAADYPENESQSSVVFYGGLAYDDFLLLVSTEFSVCLGIQQVGEKYRLNLTFQPSVIKQFLAGLAPCRSIILGTVIFRIGNLSSNPIAIAGRVTLRYN